MTEARALLLVGSPRGIDRSTSGRLGARMLDAVRDRGFRTDTLDAHGAVRSTAETERALAAIGVSDLVILALPLYVDSFPAPVIALLEQIVELRVGAGRVRFAMLIQCGFPESEHNATALAIAERFAAEAGWQWLGGLALGGLETYSDSANGVLARAGGAIAKGEPMPDLAPKRSMPAWLYRLGGNMMWRRQAKRNGAAGRLRAQPYADRPAG
jgi:hypothetical protein